MAVKSERGRDRKRERGEREREGLVTIILEIKGLSACSACSSALQFGRREQDGGTHQEADWKNFPFFFYLFLFFSALLSYLS